MSLSDAEYAAIDAYVERLRASLPTYVTEKARDIAGEAMRDMDDEHPNDRVYALARWFDAALASPFIEGQAGGGETSDDDIVSRLTDHGLYNKQERMKLFIEARDEIVRLRAAATVAPHTRWTGQDIAEAKSEATALHEYFHPPVADRAADGWQPIETAPKDGRFILAFWPNKVQETIAFDPIRGWMNGYDDNPCHQPTHWKPLDDGPVTAKVEGER